MRTARPSDLPDFKRPPVVETVLSVQFDQLLLPKTAHFGLYWAQIREKYPQTVEQGELPAIAEKETGPPALPIDIQLQTLNAPPTPRFWFINDTGTELIQVQRDRFIKNWRKVGEHDKYPHYEQLKEGFDRDFAEFAHFIESNDLGRVRVNQCEVTYINHILSGEGWQSHEDIDRVFTVWKQPDGPIPGSAEGAAIMARFPIRDSAARFCGRLHATIQPVQRFLDGRPMFLMELTARGQIGEDTQFFGIGREWIVKSFAKLTTPEMHKIWERTQ
jgi:uncharacterized protein (TIGR04255 family)